MEFTISRSNLTWAITFEGRIEKRELERLVLDGIDKRVVDSHAESAADYLQSLEIIFRRWAEQEAAAALAKEQM